MAAAAAVMKRALADAPVIGFFRQSFSLLRSLSTSVALPASSSSAASESKPKRRKKKNLFDVIQFLPEWGIGYKVAKTHWRDVSYELTKINLYKVFSSPLNSSFVPSPHHFLLNFLTTSVLFDLITLQDGRHGKAWGIRYKAGESKNKKKKTFFPLPVPFSYKKVLQRTLTN